MIRKAILGLVALMFLVPFVAVAQSSAGSSATASPSLTSLTALVAQLEAEIASLTGSAYGTGVTSNATTAINTVGGSATGANPPTVSISMSNTSIPVGSSYTVTWNSSGATSCDVVRNSSADICVNGANKCALSYTRTFAASVVGSHSYTVTCKNSSSSASQTVDYSVVPAGSTIMTACPLGDTGTYPNCVFVPAAPTSTTSGIGNIVCPSGYYMLLNGECAPGTATALASSTPTSFAVCTSGNYYPVSAPSSDPCADYVPPASTSSPATGNSATPLTVSISLDTLPMYDNTQHTLTWGSTGATSCNVIGSPPSAGVLASDPYVEECNATGNNKCLGNVSEVVRVSSDSQSNSQSKFFTIVCTNGIASASKTVNYTVLPTSVSTSGFSADRVYGTAPLTVSFQTSAASIDYGDGTQDTFTTAQTAQGHANNTNHTYNTVGTYTATSDGQSITITVVNDEIPCPTSNGSALYTVAPQNSPNPQGPPPSRGCPQLPPPGGGGGDGGPAHGPRSQGGATSTSADAGSASQAALVGAADNAPILAEINNILTSLESILAGITK